MAIQMRRGQLANYDKSKMLPGEWGISIDNDSDNQKAFISFAPGVSKEVMMVEDAEEQIAVATAEAIDMATEEAEAWAHGNSFHVNDYASGDGFTKSFTLAETPSSIIGVYVDGSSVSAYTLSGKTITFTTAPASGSNNIRVYYTVNTTTDNAKYYKEQAEAVAESIPEDYSELSDDVDQLKNALNENNVLVYAQESLINCLDFDNADTDFDHIANDSFATKIATTDSVYWLELPFEANKLYTLTVTGIVINGNANLRFYNHTKDTIKKDVVADGTSQYTAIGGDYLRIYLANGASLSVDKIRAVDASILPSALVKNIDGEKVSYETIKQQIKTKTEEAVTLELGSLNGDGTEKASDSLQRCGYFNVKRGFTYTTDIGFSLIMVVVYDQNHNFHKRFDNVSTFVSDIDGYARFVCALSRTINTVFGYNEYTNNLPKMYELVRQGLEDNVYIQTIESIQKQVIETVISEVQTGCNASLYGVLPSNTGAENSAALQTLLNNSGTIIIDLPGIYEFADTLVIKSNTKIIFGEGVYCKRTTNSNGFMINAGATTGIYDKNVVLEGLHLLCNGKSGSTNATVYGLRGQIGFFNIKNLIIKNFYCDDFPSDCYLLHIANFENVLIDGYYASGLKDGIHCSAGKNLHITNGIFQTKDDPIALNAHDYPTGCPVLGWIENVLIENCVDVSGSNNTLFFARLLSGSWSDWQAGNSYQNGDAIVAPNGCVYRCIMTTSTETYVSTVAPTAQSGSETTADGITWRFVQSNTIYNCGVKNVTFRNIHINQHKTLFAMLHQDNDGYSRSYYPGSIPPINRNIIFDNISMDNKMTYFTLAKMPFVDMKIINSQILADHIVTASSPQPMDSHVILSNNTIRNQSADPIKLVRLLDGSIVCKLYKSCNINVNGCAESNTGNVIVVES